MVVDSTKWKCLWNSLVDMSTKQIFVKNWHKVRVGKSGFRNFQQTISFKAMKWMISPWQRHRKSQEKGLKSTPWATPTLGGLVQRNKTANGT